VSDRDDKDDAPRTGLEVRPGLVIPEAELEVRRTRSGGPGGQNVNKVSTRVELRFDIASSSVLDDEQKHRLRTLLRGRTSQLGVLRVVSQRHRTQPRNEMEARRRLAELVAAALEVPKARRPTRPSRTARARRVETKRRRSDLKRARRTPAED
jgi:ribosome-associated protein